MRALRALFACALLKMPVEADTRCGTKSRELGRARWSRHRESWSVQSGSNLSRFGGQPRPGSGPTCRQHWICSKGRGQSFRGGGPPEHAGSERWQKRNA